MKIIENSIYFRSIAIFFQRELTEKNELKHAFKYFNELMMKTRIKKTIFCTATFLLKKQLFSILRYSIKYIVFKSILLNFNIEMN